MVFLDFTAKWCIACNNMERYVFNDPVIISQLSKFVLLRVDLTKADPDSMKVAQQFHVIGPPVVIFFDANGELMNMRATGEFDTEQFSQMLQEVLSFHHHH